MRLRRLSPVQSLVAIVASLASIGSFVIAIVVAIGPLSPSGNGSTDGQGPPAGAQSPTAPPQPPGYQRPDFLISDVYGCTLQPPAGLTLSFKFINRGKLDFGFSIFVQSENDLGRQWQEDEWIDEWVFDHGEQEWVSDADVELDLRAEDFDGLDQVITIRTDPTNLIKELDESNNDKTVLVPIPDSRPADYVNVACTSPAP